jgi:hypothetical protein
MKSISFNKISPLKKISLVMNNEETSNFSERKEARTYRGISAVP